MRRQERDDLYEKFESTIYDVQQKSGFKNILLERKLQAINESPHSQLSFTALIHSAHSQVVGIADPLMRKPTPYPFLVTSVKMSQLMYIVTCNS